MIALPRPLRARERARAHRPHQPATGVARGHQPVRSRQQEVHDRHEDAGAAAGARRSTASTPRSAARAATRRSRAPRSASTRSAIASSQWDPKNQRPELWNLYNAQGQQGREHPRLPALQLDRARRLAVHLPREHPDRAALLRRASGRWSSATARSSWSTTSACALAPGEKPRASAWSASARSAATR